MVAQSFPWLQQHIGSAQTFWIYGSCSAATFLFVLMFLPETKGKSLEEIEMQLVVRRRGEESARMP